MSGVALSLRRQTNELASLFERRVSSLKDRDDIISTIRSIDAAFATHSAKTFFGLGEHEAIGIDGSMDFDEVLELLLFYVCASGYACKFQVTEDRVAFSLNDAVRQQGLSMSAAVPLWEEDLPNITDEVQVAETDIDLRRLRERIPFALMTMAELYLGLDASRTKNPKLLLFDRPFSGTYPTLVRDTSLLLRRRQSALEGMSTRHGPISLADLHLVSQIGSGTSPVLPRRYNLQAAALRLLLNKGEMSNDELGRELKLTKEQTSKLVERLEKLEERFGESLVEISNGRLTPSERVNTYWGRVSEGCMRIVERTFAGSEYPLVTPEGKWLSALDLSFVNLVLMHALTREVKERGILVVGVAKDTTATEFSRAVMPIALTAQSPKAKPELSELKSDRALLTILSAVNPSKISTPWRTLAYDACFTTIFWDGEKPIPVRAARHIISREQMFIRAYFQLRSFAEDCSVRSPVFLYDRFYDQSRDGSMTKLEAWEGDRETTITPYLESADRASELDNLILYVLSISDNPEILEAYGHNQLLYLADKYVKEEVGQMKGLLRGVAELELTPLARREKVFMIARRFRDIRAASERARRRGVAQIIREEAG